MASNKFDLAYENLITGKIEEFSELNVLQRSGSAVVHQGIRAAEFITDESKVPLFMPLSFIGTPAGAVYGAIAAGTTILNGSNDGVVLKSAEVVVGSLAAFAGSGVAGWVASGVLGFGLDMISLVGTAAYIAGGLAVCTVGDGAVATRWRGTYDAA